MCCPYLQLGSWLHREAMWPRNQLPLKQTRLGNYHTLRGKNKDTRAGGHEEAFHHQHNPSERVTVLTPQVSKAAYVILKAL